MSGKRICVLGASGSVGSHLVQTLIEYDYHVTAVVRSLASAARIGRYDIDIVNADLLQIDVDRLKTILKGHDAVVDCTYSSNSICQKSIQESVKLATDICNAAKQAGIKKLIHYGTVSVYPGSAEGIDEDTDCSMQGDAYADGKLAAERVFLSESDGDTEITVLQLPVVLGPFMLWTKSTIGKMSEQRWTIPNDLAGTCSPLFVDDAVHATLLAIEHKGVPHSIGGERILLQGTANMGWSEFYQAHADLSPELSLTLLPRNELMALIEKVTRSQQPWRRFLAKFSADGDFRQLILAQWGIRSVYKTLKKLRGQDGIDKIKSRLDRGARVASQIPPESVNQPLQQANPPINIIDNKSLARFDTMPAILSDKAQRILGFTARIEIAEGLQKCGEWLKWARLLK